MTATAAPPAADRWSSGGRLPLILTLIAASISLVIALATPLGY